MKKPPERYMGIILSCLATPAGNRYIYIYIYIYVYIYIQYNIYKYIYNLIYNIYIYINIYMWFIIICLYVQKNARTGLSQHGRSDTGDYSNHSLESVMLDNHSRSAERRRPCMVTASNDKFEGLVQKDWFDWLVRMSGS